MTLKKMVCPACGGKLDSFDNHVGFGTCPYCGTMVRDDVKGAERLSFDSTGGVNVSGLEGADALYSRIETNIRFGDKSKADSLVRQFTDLYPAEFRGWRAMCELHLDEVLDGTVRQSLVRMAIERMVILAESDEERTYLKRLRKRLEGRKGEIASLRASARQTIAQAQCDVDAAEKNVLGLTTGFGAKGEVALGRRARGENLSGLVGFAAFVLLLVSLADYLDLTALPVAVIGAIFVGAAYSSIMTKAAKEKLSQISDARALRNEAGARLAKAESSNRTNAEFETYLNELLAAF